MENPNPPSLNLSAPFFITFLLNVFLLLLSPSSADTVPDNNYFINCGSRSDIVDGTNRTFVADRYYKGGDRQENKLNPSNNASLALYHTARLSRKVFSYQPEIAGNGSYLVRLHFYPTTATQSTAVFSVVSDSNFLLLSNFTARPNRTDLPVITEFLVPIAPGKFRIYFRPESSSVAYVNAIEVFLAFNGTDFTASTQPPDIGMVTPAGRAAENFTGGQLRSRVLRTVHRINAGPQAIEAKDDELWRKWVVDDPYLVNKSAAMNVSVNDATILEYTDKHIAPKMLYATAKKLSSSTRMNISWSFGVSKNARHLVRAHFCDIVGLSTNFIWFDMYIYSHFGLLVDPYVSEHYYPTYIDFVVDSDDSGFVNISVAPDGASQSVHKTAFLNGLEILEFMSKDPNFVPPPDSISNGTPAAVLGGSIGGGGLIVILILVWVWVSMRRRRKLMKASKLQPVGAGAGSGSAHSKGGSGNDDNSGVALSVSIANLGLRIPLADILLATRDFHPSSMIGEGGFGKVYEGTLGLGGDGVRVAVKRSNPEHGQGISEFRTEILVLSQFRHRHLVSLVGYCDDPPEMILVYEFIDNGTLRSHLYGDSISSAPSLSWKQRLEICIGSAKGIHYLHTSSEKAMIHRDIKSSNILLTQDCVAKVSDFGLSRSGAVDHDHVTTVVKGTIGYLDPEYFKLFQLTEKSDVYSFGVVLLEVLCARKPIDDKQPMEETSLAEWAMSMHQRGKLKHIVDASIKDEVDSNSLRKFGETVAKCLKEHGSERPEMKDVLWDLNYALQLHESAVRKGGAVGDEDSSTGALLGLPPFSWDGCDEEDEDAEDDYSTAATASHPSNVFSQIKFHDGR